MSHAAEKRSSIASSFILIGLFALFAAAMKVGQDVAIAWRYGATLDGFWFVMSLLAWPVSLASSIFTIVIVPIQFRGHHGSAETKSDTTVFGREVIGAVMVLGAVLTPLCWCLLHAALTSPWAGMAGRNLELAQRCVDVLVFVVPLGLLAAHCSAHLTINGSRMPTLIEALPAIAVIFFVALWGGDSLLYGVLAGSLAMCVAMVLASNRAGLFQMPRIGLSAKAWRGVKSGLWVVLAGQALMVAFPIVDQLFAVQLGESTASHVSFASRLLGGIQALVGVVVQRACLNALAKQEIASAEGSSSVDRRWSVIAFAAGVLMAAAMALLAGPIVDVILSRGRFTVEDEAAVVALVKAGAVQMPFYLAGIVLVSAAALRVDHAIFFWAPLVGLALKALTAFVLLGSFGACAIPLSSAALYATTALMLFARSTKPSAT